MTSNHPSDPSPSPQAESHIPVLSGSPGKYAPCPVCGQRNAKEIQFTWWGGAVGPSMFTHVKCQSCKMEYNGKTGRSNDGAIAVYTIVCTAILLGLFVALRFFVP
jgi:hypothetical protein